MGVDIWRHMKGSTVLWMAHTFSFVALIFEGLNQGATGTITTLPDFVRVCDLGVNGVVTKTIKQGGLVSIYYFGACFGCFFGGWVGDQLGRRMGVLIGAILCLLGGCLMAGTQNANMFICARVIGGVGIGFNNAIVPAWVSELAKSHSRGFTFSIVFSANYFGIMIANWIMYGVRNFTGGFHWRFPLGILTAPSLFLIVTVWFIPESPRWLVGNGQVELAREILSKLRGDAPLNDPELEAEMAQLVAMAEAAKHKRNSLYNIVLCGRYSGRLHLGRRAVLSFGALFLMMYTGIMAMSTYSPILFAASGASTLKVGWMAGLNQTIGFLGTLAAAPIVDRFGRRRTFYAGLLIQLVVLFMSSAFAKISNDAAGTPRGTHYGMAASAMIYLYQWFFCQTTLVVCWVYPTEIWPQEIRAKGNAFGILGWAVGGGSTTLLLPTMFARLGWKTLLVFACLNVMVLPLVYLFFPETANRSLEEINLLFSLDNPVVSRNEKEYKRMMDEAGGEPAVAERRLLDEVDAAYGEKETNPGGMAEAARAKGLDIQVEMVEHEEKTN